MGAPGVYSSSPFSRLHLKVAMSAVVVVAAVAVAAAAAVLVDFVPDAPLFSVSQAILDEALRHVAPAGAAVVPAVAAAAAEVFSGNVYVAGAAVGNVVVVDAFAE